MQCTTLQEVIAELRASGALRIAIDGDHGAGKSTLAKALAFALQFQYIELDSYLERNQRAYVDYIDYGSLAVALKTTQSFVIEGVCLLEVLERVNFRPQANIYLKRMRYGIWADEERFDIFEPLDEVLVKAREMASLFSSTPVVCLGLDEEVIRYHARFRPHHSADITFLVEAR